MGFLKNEIRNQKWLEKEAEISAFLKANNISDDALIYELHLDKKVYKTEVEVREYLESKYLSADNIDEVDGIWHCKTLNYSQVDLSTAITIQIRRGVTALAADLIRYTHSDYNFSDKFNFKYDFKLATINFDDDKKDLPQVIEIARVVEGDHPTYGKISITKEHLKTFVVNFGSKVTGTDLAINEDHKKNEAFGWFKDVFLSESGEILYGTVNWNAKGIRALSEKEYRYFSPEFRFNYKHPHTGVEHGATLLGGALTNYPFLKMDAITELSEKQKTPIKETKKMDTIELSVHTSKVVELSAKINEAEARANASAAQVIELSNKVKTLEENASKVTKEIAHKKLFDANKINAAQLVALNEGKSMLEVMALNEPMNTKASGATGTSTDNVELSEADKKSMKAFGLTEEEYRTANKIS